MSMKKKVNKVRINLRIPKHLRLWLEEYSLRNNTTVTQVIVDLITKRHSKDSFRGGDDH